MSKFDKFKQIFDIAAPIAGEFLPGAAGSALSDVSGILNGRSASPASTEAITKLAADNDDQTKAILSMFEAFKAQKAEIEDLKSRLATIEAK